MYRMIFEVHFCRVQVERERGREGKRIRDTEYEAKTNFRPTEETRIYLNNIFLMINCECRSCFRRIADIEPTCLRGQDVATYYRRPIGGLIADRSSRLVDGR